MSEEQNASRARGHHITGVLNYHLEVFGDHLAKREGYRVHAGLDAVRFYLMNKHGWLPRDVITMSESDLRWALAEEIDDWTLPPEAQGHYSLDSV